MASQKPLPKTLANAANQKAKSLLDTGFTPPKTTDGDALPTPDQLVSQAQKSLEDLYFAAAGIGTEALEGFLVLEERHDIIDRQIPFAILDVTRFENHKAPFGTIDGWNIKTLVDMGTGGGPKIRTLSFAANKYRDAFFSVIREGVIKAQGEAIGPWGMRFVQNASGQETYDVRPFHILNTDERPA